ncbi:MAG: WYL domain-containing protein [Xanthomonadales bacterium]|nr:WYL domain-containing protein [Xanthomonadales bacterium]
MMPDTSLRQLAMLKLIPRRAPGITCRELEEKLAARDYRVSRRTIERDLRRLSGPFALVCDDGHPERWAWMEGAFDALPAHDAFSALTWQLIEDCLQPLLPRPLREEVEPQFEAARQFLRETGARKFERWRERVRMLPRAFPLQPPEIVSDVLNAVYEALLESRQVSVVYRSRGAGEPRPLTLNPLGLVVRDSVYYLVATIEPFTDIRQTVLHRMQSAEVHETPVREPDGFNLEAYIAEGNFQYVTGREIRLVARFDDYAAQHLLETPISENQRSRKLKDGRVEITATVRESGQLFWWLLGFGTNVEVVGPRTLRKEIAAEIESLHALYAK